VQRGQGAHEADAKIEAARHKVNSACRHKAACGVRTMQAVNRNGAIQVQDDQLIFHSREKTLVGDFALCRRV
jgi:hypothetical protein